MSKTWATYESCAAEYHESFVNGNIGFVVESLLKHNKKEVALLTGLLLRVMSDNDQKALLKAVGRRLV